MLTAEMHVFSVSVFCTGPLDPTSASKKWENTMKNVIKDKCKNRNDIAGHSIAIDWPACPGIHVGDRARP